MPLAGNGDCGTNADGSTNFDYCRYCYKDGKFLQDISMDEMIDHCAQFVECQHADPPLEASFEDEHHHVSVPDAEAVQIGCGAVRLFLQLSESEPPLGAVLAYPEQCLFVGLFGSPCVHHIVCEVEMLRHDELKVLLVVLLGGETNLF